MGRVSPNGCNLTVDLLTIPAISIPIVWMSFLMMPSLTERYAIFGLKIYIQLKLSISLRLKKGEIVNVGEASVLHN